MNSTQQNDPWSISLGRWGPLTVRLHMVYLLFVVFTLFLGWICKPPDMLLGGLSLAVLTASVLIHELGHFFATRQMGGQCESIVLWPFGGVSPADRWSSPRKGLAAALAGPAANLLVCLVCLPILAVLDKGVPVWHYLQPFYPDSTGDLSWLALLFWINWVLFLVNLIPAHPFDGGHALYHLLALLWPKTPESLLRPIVAWTGQVFAVGLLVLGGAAQNAASDAMFPLWLPLSLLAIFVFFAARHYQLRFDDAEQVPEETNRQVSPDLTGLDEEESSESLDGAAPLEDWIDESRESTGQQREKIEADEEQRVDEILARLHKKGMGGLSRQDREFLERVSARYRNRQESR
jgi:stage IV sporulation protein FB